MNIKTPVRRVYYPDKDVSYILNSVRRIAVVSGKENVPKADDIVRALNAHGELVDALKAILAAGETGLMEDWYPAREKARAALALIEEA